MNNNSVIERLNPVFTQVDQQVKRQMSTDVPFVAKVSEHILHSGGKHLRPVLFVLSAQLCDYQGDREYYFSSAFEYLHSATLLHDDVVDGAETRRGRTAAHVSYGNPGVILVGDYLLAKAMGLCAETGILEFMSVMAATVGLMAEGEVLQLLHARDSQISETDYERVIYRKTATLIESACYLGAILAEAPTVQATALRSYGRKIGLAFQVIDDCLDYTGTQSEFGKPVGHDLDEGKITLPLIRTLQQVDDQDKTELLELILKESRTTDEFARVKELVDKYRGLDQANERAAELSGEAKRSLDIFPDCHQKEALAGLADFIVTRRK